ncbi:Hypothetical protein PA1329 [Klebsiella pneumoniae IS46]|nr:Hypothetical protein PA1329 [Klebsiella pneumoniae IS46]
MVIVFYYRPLLTIRASVILVRERMMNKSQQVQTITLAAAQQMAAAVQKKATEIKVAVVFPWLTTEATRCLFSGWTRPSSPAAIFP